MTRFSVLTWTLVGVAAVLRADEPARAEKSTHQPAPTTVGAPPLAGDELAGDEEAPPDAVPSDADTTGTVEAQKVNLDAAEWQRQYDALQARVEALEGELVGLRNRQGDVEKLRDRVLQLEEQNRQLRDQLVAMQPPEQTDTADDPGPRTAFKPHARVRLYNWVGDGVRFHVNGTWHTLKQGVNTVPVPYGPVTVHRWQDGPPRFFDDWQTDETGFVMEFNVGVPPAKSTNNADWN